MTAARSRVCLDGGGGSTGYVVGMQKAREQRPPISTAVTGTDLHRWYWLKNELIELARLLGLRTTGSKKTLTDRISAHLAGRIFHESPINQRRKPARYQLHPPLFERTLVPCGQRCTQILRTWFRERVGATFTFDAEMRHFVLHTDGSQTLGDVLEHWHQTRDSGVTRIGAQFEYNLFTPAWSSEHPHGTRGKLLSAWWQYRGTPVDERGGDVNPSPAGFR